MSAKKIAAVASCLLRSTTAPGAFQPQLQAGRDCL
jgi:hypothetical protein